MIRKTKKSKSLINGIIHFLKKRARFSLLVLFTLGIFINIFPLLNLSTKILETTSLQDAQLYSEAISEFRTQYTSQVVSKAKSYGIEVTHDYLQKDNAIPLPATLSILIGNEIAKNGNGGSTKLYSAYPFPWRQETGGLQDQFAKDAWTAFSNNSKEPFYRFETQNGKKFLRYAIADIMRPKCINCHNTHPSTPRKGWRNGDVRGVLEVTRPLDTVVAKIKGDVINTLFISFFGTVGFTILLSLILGRLRSTSISLEASFDELVLSEKKIKTIVNNTLLGIFQTDVNGKFTYINTIMGQYFDMGIDEINEKAWYSIISEKGREQIQNSWEKSLQNQSRFDEEIEFCINDRSGDYRWAKIKTTPMKLKDGKVSGYLGTFEEITDEKEKSKLIESQKTLIVESSRLSSLGEMAGGIAHEINNPITVISSNLRVVKKLMERKNIVDDEIFDYLKESERTVQRISGIVQGLRTISRDASDDDFEKVQFKEILSDVLVLCREKFKKQRIEICFNEEDINLEIEIECKRIQLSQVFVNLFNNSYDAICGLDEKWIKIQVEDIGEKIKVTFTDSGAGISKDVQAKMFQPFFTTKEIGKGTGIGLSLSLSIVKQHNGAFEINNDSSHTEFVIILWKTQEKSGEIDGSTT